MERSKAEEIVSTLEEAGIVAEIYEKYSGRGMYGRHTTGVVSSRFAFEEMPELQKFRWDSLGLSIIWY